MRIILCLDDKDGILFNGRRQSRDAVIYDRICQRTEGKTLWASTYSAKLFPQGAVKAEDDFFSKAGNEDYCFVESGGLLPYLTQAEEIIVYRWNRVYPADVKLPQGALGGREIVSCVDFPGNSHQKITEVVYR